MNESFETNVYKEAEILRTICTVINQKPQMLFAYYKCISFISPPHDADDGNPAGIEGMVGLGG